MKKIKKKERKKMLKKIQETKIHAIPCFPAGSFAVHIGDHLRSGIICGAVQKRNTNLNAGKKVRLGYMAGKRARFSKY